MASPVMRTDAELPEELGAGVGSGSRVTVSAGVLGGLETVTVGGG